MTRLVELAQASAEVATVSSRLAKTRRLAGLLRSADVDDIAAIVAWLSGDLLQRRIGVGWASVATMPPPAASPSLTVRELNATFATMAGLSGAGSQTRRTALLESTLSAVTDVEQRLLRNLLAGGLRQGALAGVMTEAIAEAAGVGASEVRRAAMLRGDLPAVAEAAMRGGSVALAAFRLEVGRAVAPMLAQSASSVEEALAALDGEVAFEAKLDGARIQIHKRGDEVRLYTRSLDDITARLPDIAQDVRRWPAQSIVADGEIMALRSDSRPMTFQETSARVARKRPVQVARGHVRSLVLHGPAEESSPKRLSIFVFDLLHLDGVDLLDHPGAERHAALARVLEPAERVERLVTRDVAEARAFLDRMLRAGYEGVVAKALAAPYEAGRRGASWLKIKPVLTLDLVVLAVEWGSGRRTGKLSNIHLGARDPEGGFVMLGKTFKGMTDEMLAWQTKRFLELAEGPIDGYVVKVRPEQVVEIALDGIQTSSRYPAKMALRFARVLRYREDKSAAEADTVDAVRAIHRGASATPRAAF